MSNYEIVTIKGGNIKDIDILMEKFKDILEYNLSGDSSNSFVLRNRGEWNTYKQIEEMIENNKLLREENSSIKGYYQFESEKNSRIYKINHNKNKSFLENIEISYVFIGDYINSKILNKISNYYKKIDSVKKTEEDSFHINDHPNEKFEKKFIIENHSMNTRKNGSFIEVEIISGPLKNHSEDIDENMTEIKEMENKDEFKDIKIFDLNEIPF